MNWLCWKCPCHYFDSMKHSTFYFLKKRDKWFGSILVESSYASGIQSYHYIQQLNITTCIDIILFKSNTRYTMKTFTTRSFYVNTQWNIIWFFNFFCTNKMTIIFVHQMLFLVLEDNVQMYLVYLIDIVHPVAPELCTSCISPFNVKLDDNYFC